MQTLGGPWEKDRNNFSGRLIDDIHMFINTDSQTFENKSMPLIVNTILIKKAIVNRNNSWQRDEELVGFHIHSGLSSEFSWRIFEHAWIILKYVGWTFRTYIHIETLLRTKVTKYPSDTVSPIPCLTKSPWLLKVRNLEYLINEFYRTSSYRVGIATRFRDEEKRNITPMSWLQKTQCRINSRFICITQKRQIHRLSRRYWSVLKLGNK